MVVKIVKMRGGSRKSVGVGVGEEHKFVLNVNQSASLNIYER